MYRTEVSFYRDLGAATEMAVPCHHAEIDERTQDFVIVLDDLSDAVALDQLVGCPPDRAAAVVAALADLHARHWDEVGLAQAPWLARLVDHATSSRRSRPRVRATWPEVRARCASDLDESVVALGDRLEELVPVMTAALGRPPVTLVHGDLRLDNLFFAAGGVWLCDWQLAGLSRGVRDLAYFLTQSLSPVDREACERPSSTPTLPGSPPTASRLRRRPGMGRLPARHPVGPGLRRGRGRRARPGRPPAPGLTRAMLQRAAAAVVDHDCASLGERAVPVGVRRFTRAE